MVRAVRNSAVACGVAILAAATVLPSGTDGVRSATAHAAWGIRSNMELGDELTAERDFGAARKAYTAAAALSRRAGQLPLAAERRIANAYYFEGEYGQAARTLDRLADEAADFGQVEAQAWALADAAWLAALDGDADGEARYLAEIDGLAEEHGLPDEMTAAIAKNLMRDFVVFAPHLNSW